ncbi:MAG: hypothetical protein JO132_19090 [Streptosporangiaceae bacterium]|nr:hypothetical protein [Streptosporangiaceae bacterium]
MLPSQVVLTRDQLLIRVQDLELSKQFLGLAARVSRVKQLPGAADALCRRRDELDYCLVRQVGRVVRDPGPQNLRRDPLLVGERQSKR